MAYVGGSLPPSGCVFCRAIAADDDPGHLVLKRAARTFLILNAYPYTSGHLMAVVNRHLASVVDAAPEELAELMQLAGEATRLLRAEYRADGFNIGINQGRVAGAGIEDHLHVHVVPRWNGDTNFMSVVGEVRVLPEALDATYRRLRTRLDE
jgi:ATP adenylyltransferase